VMSVAGRGGGRNFVSANRVPREEPRPLVAASVIVFAFPAQAVPILLVRPLEPPVRVNQSDHSTAAKNITRDDVDSGIQAIAAPPGSRVTLEWGITDRRLRGRLEETDKRAGPGGG